MFEHSLIDLDSKPRPRRWLSLPIAVGLHAVGLTAFAFASYWSVGEVPEPQTNVVFVSLAPLPELPAGGGGPRPEVKPPTPQDQEKPPVAKEPVQPTVDTIPDTIPATPTTTTPVENLIPGPATGDDGPSFPGGPGCEGCPPGPGEGPGPGGPGISPSGDGNDDQPRVITVGMTKPTIVHQVQPRYTELARRAGIQGTVIVEAVIDQKGYVTNARVLRGLPMGLDRAAVEAIQQWRFKPATLANQPVKVYFTLTVNFTIQR
jgi:periplasmic protein TonB